jgi:membrane associated rhomboid family serine protease
MLITFLIFVYQIELILASVIGYNSPFEMLDKFPYLRILAGTVGPLLHSDASHLVGNLGVLLFAGLYIEYLHGTRCLYILFFASGYVGAWIPALLVGASIGASGATWGLIGFALFSSLYNYFSPIVEQTSGSNSPSQIIDALSVLNWGYIIPLALTIWKSQSVFISVFVKTGTDSGDLSHLVGFILGVVFGLSFILRQIRSEI